MEGSSPPVACSLSHDDLAQRAARWDALAARALRHTALTKHGLQLAFAAEPGVADELESLVALERECCAFAAWSVRASVDQLTIEISGESEEAVTAVQALFSGLRASLGRRSVRACRSSRPFLANSAAPLQGHEPALGD